MIFYIKKNLPVIISLIVISIIIFPIIVMAITGGGTGDSTILDSPIQFKTFKELMTGIAKIVSQIGIMVAALFFVYAGFLYVSARGSEDQIKKAHSVFTWTAIGTLLLLGAWVIAEALEGTIKLL